MSERSLEQLINSDIVQSMVSTAQLDFGLEYEAAFVMGAAYLGGLLSPPHTYTEELIALLRYPEDDVGASIRLLEAQQEMGAERFDRFAKHFGVSRSKMEDAHEIANLLILPNKRFTRGICPNSRTSKVEAVTGLFVQSFICNPCIFIGDTTSGDFLDYEKNYRFDISPQSRLYASPGFRRAGPAVYYRLLNTVCCDTLKVPFLCVVPVRMITLLKYSKIYNDNFSVGQVVAQRIINHASSYNRESSDPAYISVRAYDEKRSELQVLYTNNSRDIMLNVIRSKIVEVAEELKQLQRRHWWLKRYHVNTVVGPGLKVQSIIINDQEADSIRFEPKANFTFQLNELTDIFMTVRRINKNTTFMMICEEKSKRENFIVSFPSVDEASEALYIIRTLPINKRFGIEVYHVLDAFDFLQQQSIAEARASKLSDETTCVICYSKPLECDVFRLFLCGHAYCVGCFTKNIEHAERFPVSCAMVDCVGIITFNDIDRAFSRRPLSHQPEFCAMMDEVIGRAVKNFMRASRNGYKKCMSKDCNGILDVPRLLASYKMSLTADSDMLNEAQAHLLAGKAIDCERCGKARCAMCGYDFHLGFDCQEYYARNFVYNNQQLAEWKNANPNTRRFCPNNECHILMEKAEGCNHMQCTVCYIHFCWLCKDFQTPDSRGIYEHMTKVHGGNGLALDDFHLFL